METVPVVEQKKISSGIAALDIIMAGGLVPGQSYLVRGGAGVGKTTMGWHFLTADPSSSLFITFTEPEENLRKNAAGLGFKTEGTSILDLSPNKLNIAQCESYDIFLPSEVEGQPITQRIVEAMDSVKPRRVFIDSLTLFSYLAPDDFQRRKQVLTLLRFLVKDGATVMFTSENCADAPDDIFMFAADSVINMDYRANTRMLQVSKFRGSDFVPGWHHYEIGAGGVGVFPILFPARHAREFTLTDVQSGIPEMDELLHGGITKGTVTAVSGPSGVGKTTLGMQFMKEAAGRGERSVVFLFEESPETLRQRCRSIGIHIDQMEEHDKLSIYFVEPLRYTALQFADMLRREVEDRDASIVMLDSSKGFSLALRGEDLEMHIARKCQYLKNMGVTAILINECDNVSLDRYSMASTGISYLADTVITLNFFERGGLICKSLGVQKKRTGDFEKSPREFEITRYGIKVGAKLAG